MRYKNSHHFARCAQPIAAALRVSAWSVFLLLSTLACPDATSRAQEISDVRQALATSYINNPQIAAARQQLYAALERFNQAKAVALPSLLFTAKVTPFQQTTFANNDKSKNPTATERLQLNQSLFRWFRNYYDIKSADIDNHIAYQEYQMQEQQLLAQVASIYSDIVRLRTQLLQQQQNQRHSGLLVEATQARLQAGSGNNVDLALAKAELTSAQQMLTQTEIDLAGREQDFQQLTGNKLATAAQLPDFNWLIQADETRDAYLQRVSENNPTLITLRQRLENAKMRFTQGQVTPLPVDVNLVAGIQWQQNLGDKPTTGSALPESSYDVSIDVAIPIYQGGSSGSLRRQTRASWQAAQSLLNANNQTILNQARNLHQQREKSSILLAAAESVVTSRELIADSMRQENEFGLKSNLDLLDAQRNLLTAQLNLINVKAKIVATDLEYLQIAGDFIPEKLDLGIELIDEWEYYKSVNWRFDYFE